MPARVLHTITGLNMGGAEIMLARFLEQLDPHALSSTVLSLLPPGALHARVARSSSEVITIDMARGLRPLDVVRLARCVRQAAVPDLFHGWMYHGNMAAMAGSILARRFRPIVWSIHHTVTRLSDESASTRRLIRLSARLSSRTSAISYCSRVSADDHERLGFDPERRVLIPNGTDCDVFKPLPEAGARLRKLLDLPSQRLLIGHVGRFHPMKDQVNLVRALGRVVAEGHDVQGIFIGQGHVEGPVRTAARELGIDERITTLDVRTDLPELLPGLDLYVLSSAWGEACSLATAEAMACGVPAVVTDVGDSAWLVGSSGVVVKPGEPEALAAGMRTLLTMDADRRRELGARARRRIVEEFSLSLYVRRHLDLYERVLSERPAVPSARAA